jgi:hypothetical protein
MKMILRALVMLVVLFMFFPAEARISKELKEAFFARFTPAEPHKGLETGAANLEKEKLKTFVVVERDNVIPAERAFYLISPGEYDYRGALVNGERVETRYGQVYTYLPKGTVMAVAGVEYSGDKIYLKLISIKKVQSPLFPKKEPTRVTVMLGFKFPKDVIAARDMERIFGEVEGWVKPFPTIEDAVRYSEK